MALVRPPAAAAACCLLLVANAATPRGDFRQFPPKRSASTMGVRGVPPKSLGMEAGGVARRSAGTRSRPVAETLGVRAGRSGRSQGERPKKPLSELFTTSRRGVALRQRQPLSQPVDHLPPQVLAGSAIGLFPFIYATYEFWWRIYTQRQCGMCEGAGLVYRDQDGDWLPGSAKDVFAKRRLRKCPTCGGFIPWLGWGFFFFSNKYVDPGRGGPLQRPSKNFKEMSDQARAKREQKLAAKAEVEAAEAAAAAAGGGAAGESSSSTAVSGSGSGAVAAVKTTTPGNN
eukprot:CAMPEP_0197544504 /NCGR_PEP_ID=MMETSP1318-20131121/68803_1 /TAXON_ID=552666 /ORGANISM="Partenskyella glossopodia, Strain RCC365" /LENGTH=285 /DNA_ID=CAMNT_0043103905 /DNA_START=174 /DNA_END=1028 /DNA_ORIENTATION=+